MKLATTDRFMELEGLRIIAAVIVVIYHALLIFYPGFFYGIGNSFATIHNIRFEDNLYANPFAGLLSGTFAVGIFFVLSGFVLTVGYFTKKDDNIIKRMAAKRYLRLMLPALASVLIVFVILVFGLNAGMEGTVEKTQSLWLDRLWGFAPNLWDALVQGTQGIFAGSIAETGYNPVLWTIFYEFLGSFIVFVLALAFGRSQYRWVAYAVAAALLFQTWLIGFILGMVLADVYVNKREIIAFLNNKLTYLLIPIAVFLGGFPSGEIATRWYQAIRIPYLNDFQNITFYVSVGATLLVLVVLALPRVNRFFANKYISKFGRYSYSLYLLHMPVLFTVCVGTFNLLVGRFSFNFHLAAAIAFIAACLVLMGVTYLFEKYVDGPSIRLSSSWARFFFSTAKEQKRDKVS